MLIHGLFGNLDNLGVLARELNQHCKVIKVDLRNHGLSLRSEEMSYPAMAQDLLTLPDDLQLEQVIVTGHLMGGKAAMALTALHPVASISWLSSMWRLCITAPAVTTKFLPPWSRQRRWHHPAPTGRPTDASFSLCLSLREDGVFSSY